MQLAGSMLARNTMLTSQPQLFVARSTNGTSQLQMLLNLARNPMTALQIQLLWNPMVTYLMKLMEPKCPIWGKYMATGEKIEAWKEKGEKVWGK